MSPVSHQTIKLSKGKHNSPANGACVMELASMLAGESFTDHPASVCPAIAAFLRAYNDSVDDVRRQSLYAYAARVVGSRASEEVEQARSERLIRWANERRRRRWGRPPAVNSARLAGRARHLDPEIAGARAAKAIRRHTDESHAAALILVDELLAIADRPQTTPIPRLLPTSGTRVTA